VSDGAVLVVTARFDPTADRVVTALGERGTTVFRMDTAEFPAELAVTGHFDGRSWSGTLATASRTVELADVTGIYYRRPTGFAFPAGMSPAEREWADREARLGLGGLLAACPNWLNHPHRIASADHKPLQLALAAAAGLTVPRTLVTNDPDAAAGFADQVGPVAVKPFGPNHVADGDSYTIAFARQMTADDLHHASIAATAHQFQQWIDADHAVRLTAVDGRTFAAAIHAHSDAARIDWRSDYSSLTYDRIETPDGVAAGVLDLMRELHLRFAALDFLVDDAGRWWFLEIGANAQWAWIDQVADPIAQAIADALTKGRT
jgi:ATP-grasp ribosomal peptide maturase